MNHLIGWTGEEAKKIFKKVLNENNIESFCELGSFLGTSAKAILDNRVNENMKLYCVDIWDRDWIERNYDKKIKEWVFGHIGERDLYETFLDNLREYKDNVIPIKNTTLRAVQTLYSRGIKIDAFYVDANHEYNSVKEDLNVIKKLYPSSIICGDDFDFEGVEKAVNECAEEYSQKVHTTPEGMCWLLEDEIK
jgi:hypothetical protein